MSYVGKINETMKIKSKSVREEKEELTNNIAKYQVKIDQLETENRILLKILAKYNKLQFEDENRLKDLDNLDVINPDEFRSEN